MTFELARVDWNHVSVIDMSSPSIEAFEPLPPYQTLGFRHDSHFCPFSSCNSRMTFQMSLVNEQIKDFFISLLRSLPQTLYSGSPIASKEDDH